MRQTTLAIILLLLIAATGFVWYRYIRPPSAKESPGLSDAPDSSIAQYRALYNFEPDLSIFSDRLFEALERARPATTAPTLPTGRANPFAPF